jgi:sortase A
LKKRTRGLRVCAAIALLALAGIGLLAYPVVSNYLFVVHASEGIQSYEQSVEDKGGEEELAGLWAKAEAYNENLEGNPAHDPFLTGSGMALGDDYAQVLDLGTDGLMGYIQIPKIGVKLSIFHGMQDKVLSKGVGHLEGSSMPIGGEGSHSVLAAHSGLAQARLFTDLTELRTGDDFYIHVLDKVLAYRVDQITTVLPEETDTLRRSGTEDYCTLVTCTPYGINTHRLLVRGVRIEYIKEAEETQLSAAASSAHNWVAVRNSLLGVLLGAAAGLLLLALYVAIRAIRRRVLTHSSKAEGFWWEA